jgi:N4-gp56 family major capsid protein
MAATSYGVNHPLAVKAWSRTLYHEALKEAWIGKFIGKSTNSLIQKKTELSKEAGDRITIGLRMQLTGSGVQGDETLEGNEEALTTYSDNVFINQLRHAVRSGGKMSEQRIPFSVREEAMMGLRDWLADKLDFGFFNQISGNSAQTDTKLTGNNAVTAPDTAHLFAAAGHDTEASLSATTTHALKLVDIDRAVAKAETFATGDTPIIRPLRVDGENMYVLFIHNWQEYQLRRDASTAGNFFDIQKAAMQGGKISDNPIFKGGSFVYNRTIVHTSPRVPIITGTPASGAATDYRRAIFCGAQAASIAFGGSDDGLEGVWREELFDYKNQLGVGGGLIWGLKKMIFNSKDFGTIAISGYAPAQ